MCTARLRYHSHPSYLPATPLLSLAPHLFLHGEYSNTHSLPPGLACRSSSMLARVSQQCLCRKLVQNYRVPAWPRPPLKGLARTHLPQYIRLHRHWLCSEYASLLCMLGSRQIKVADAIVLQSTVSIHRK